MEFIIYSIFGYILECIYSSIIEKRININRGFMLGPYCPIYGISILCISIITKNHYRYALLLPLVCIFIALIEYITAFLLEKIFNRSWWDYSRKKYNIKGRVCLENVIIFGIGAIFIAKRVTPLLSTFLMRTSQAIAIISFLSFIVFILDFGFSIKRHYLTSQK